MSDDKKNHFLYGGSGENLSPPPTHKRVLNNISLSFFYGAKIGVIGLNGSGKSTLLRIIAGKEKSFEGQVVFSPGYSIGLLEQDPQLDESKTVKEIIEEGLGRIVSLLHEYEEIANRFS